MTPYRYVPSKDALPDGVVARVPTDLAINPAAADWRLFFGFLHGIIIPRAPAELTMYA